MVNLAGFVFHLISSMCRCWCFSLFQSFFGRTYNNLAALGECKNSGQCVINKKNRTSCKSCRLKKCLLVGMSKSGGYTFFQDDRTKYRLRGFEVEAWRKSSSGFNRWGLDLNRKCSLYLDTLYLPFNTFRLMSVTIG